MSMVFTLQSLLNSLRDKPCYFQRLPGSNGDMMHEMGSIEAFKIHGITLETNPRYAEVIIFDGGASMTNEWKIGFDYLDSIINKHPDKEIVILPSTFSFAPGFFREILDKTHKPTTIFAREEYSHNLLKDEFRDTGNVRIGIDHDMAFYLEHTHTLASHMKGKPANNYILFVERNDIEAPKGSNAQNSSRIQSRNFFTEIIPPQYKLWLKRLLARKSCIDHFPRNMYGQKVMSKVYSIDPLLRNFRVYPFDISRTDISSLESFFKYIYNARAVVTTRLHVGIIGALMGKDVFLVYGGALDYKRRGIAEYSLSRYVNVRSVSVE